MSRVEELLTQIIERLEDLKKMQEIRTSARYLVSVPVRLFRMLVL